MYVGQPLRRREDDKFLKGRGRYVDDIEPADAAHIAFVRSPHAHALIKAIDTAGAAAMPGVLRVLSASDWEEAGLGVLTCVHPMPFSDGRPMNEALRPVFAAGKVRHVGDVLAAVIAEDRYQAADAAEAVMVEYDPLPAVTDIARALDDDSPVLHEQFATNLVFEIERGDAAATQAEFASAHHIVSLTLDSNRLRALRSSHGPTYRPSMRPLVRSPCGRPPRRRTICGAGSPSTRCSCPSTRSG